MITETLSYSKIHPPLSRKEAFRLFIREFNKEAKLQGSKWFAEVQNAEDLREDYHFLYISKVTGWFIFKQKISFHVGCYSGKGYPDHFSLVDNDYALTKYGEEQNREIFSYFPEFASILEKMPIIFVILRKYSREDYEERRKDIEKRLKELETFMLKRTS